MNNEQTINQTKIQKLNDDQLVKYLDKVFSYERKLNQVIILALGEIQERRLYAYHGYASLFEMMVKHFKLSETAVYQRLNTMKLIKAIPEVHGMIESGNLSLTNAAMAQSVIQKIEKMEDKKLTVHEKHEIVQSVSNKTQKQAQVALTEIHPVASLPKTIEKPITAELTQIQVLLNKVTYEKLQTLKSLYSHKVPDGDLNKLFELLISSAVQNHQFNKASRKKVEANEAQNSEAEMIVSSFVDVTNDNQVTELVGENKMKKAKKISNLSSTIINNKRYVCLSVKRKIYQRAGGQCEFINEKGHRCQSSFQLEFDHIQSVSHGGCSEIENIQLLCRFHNQFKVNKTHGFFFRKI